MRFQTSEFPGEEAFCKTPLPPDPHSPKLLVHGGSRWSPRGDSVLPDNGQASSAPIPERCSPGCRFYPFESELVSGNSEGLQDTKPSQ